MNATRSESADAPPGANGPAAELAGRHLRIGWWSLLLFLSLGIGLEALHGFKSDWFLNVANEARRSLLRLSHAHGTLLSLIHIAFAFALCARPKSAAASTLPRWARAGSPCLNAATILLPGGFFLAGIYLRGEHAGIGIYLVPIGGLLLLAAVLVTALRLGEKSAPAADATVTETGRAGSGGTNGDAGGETKKGGSETGSKSKKRRKRKR